MRILLVEDDDMLGEATKSGLEQEAYAVDWVVQKEEALAALQGHQYSVVLLDLGLPDGEGIEILRHLRNTDNSSSILIITARDTLTDRISGLDEGADDYLVKPYDLEELFARIRAVSRRNRVLTNNLLMCGELQLDTASLKVWKNSNSITLGPKEFRILQKLIEHRGRIITKDQLEDTLYSWGHEVESNIIEVHVHRIRKKLGNGLIKTIRGMGYILE